MVKDKDIDIFSDIIAVGAKLNVSAILYSPRRRIIPKSPQYYILYFLGIIYFSLDCCFLAVTGLRIYKDETISFNEILKVWIHGIARVIALIFQYYTILYRKKIETYLKQMFIVHCLFQSKLTIFEYTPN